jgi:hypothetical protein
LDDAPRQVYIGRVSAVITTAQSRLDWLPAGVVFLAAAVLDPAGRSFPGTLVLLVVLAAVRVWLGPTGSRPAYLVRVVGLTAVAADELATAWWVRHADHPDSIDRAVLVVWTVMLVIYLGGVARLSAERLRLAPPVLAAGVVFGLVTFVLWALLCLMAPNVPTSNVPAVLALSLAALAAIQWTRRDAASTRPVAIAGLSAAATVAFLSAAFIDGVLPHLGRWVSTSAPPVPMVGPHGPYRLVDSVGLFLLGTLIVVALLVTTLRPMPVPARETVSAHG